MFPRYFKTMAGFIRFDSEKVNGVWVDGGRITILNWDAAMFAVSQGSWTEVTAEEVAAEEVVKG